MNRTIQFRSMLAVASPWRPDYDKPMMGRVVWVSSHKWEPCYEGLPVDGQCAQDNKQHWAVFIGNGRMVQFTTPEHGEYETGVAIKPPHKRKGQARPWTYKAGAWGCFANI